MKAFVDNHICSIAFNLHLAGDGVLVSRSWIFPQKQLSCWCWRSTWHRTCIHACIQCIVYNCIVQLHCIQLYCTINCSIYSTHSLRPRPDGRIFRNYPCLRVLYSDSQRVALTYIGQTSHWVTKSGTKGLWTCKFLPKNTFFGYNIDFLATGGAEGIFDGLNPHSLFPFLI